MLCFCSWFKIRNGEATDDGIVDGECPIGDLVGIVSLDDPDFSIAGAEKASYVAEKTLRKVYKKVGFVAK